MKAMRGLIALRKLFVRNAYKRLIDFVVAFEVRTRRFRRRAILSKDQQVHLRLAVSRNDDFTE